MEGFKANPKMKSQLACYKEGGFVTKKQLVAYEKKEDKAEEKKDMAEDKKIAKKAISQHEAAQHKGEAKTELKLKHGRRVKREGGVVNKFKKGGAVDAAEKGKPSGAKDPIKKVKAAPKKAATPSRAKTKAPEVPGKETGPGPSMGGTMVSPEAATMAAAPSPATMLPDTEGMQNMARGRRVRPFFNEEPDDMTAVPTKPRKMLAPKRVSPLAGAGMGAVSDAERQQVIDMFQGGPGQGSVSDYEMDQMQGYAFGGMVPGQAGLGNAMDTGPLGAAGPMGAPRNVPLSPQEMDIMRGLQAVGSYCKGGKAY